MSYDVDLNDLYAGTKPAPAQTSVKKTKTDTHKQKNIKPDADNFIKANGTNKKDNYTITIKIDAGVEEYLRNIEIVSILQDRRNTTKNQYINDLIKADIIKRLGLSKNASNIEIKKAWDTYLHNNKLC